MGGKEAPKAFYDILRDFLVEGLGAKMSMQDECLFRFAVFYADGKSVVKLAVSSHDSAEPPAFVGTFASMIWI